MSPKDYISECRKITMAFERSEHFIAGYVTNIADVEDEEDTIIIMFLPDVDSDERHDFRIIQSKNGAYSFTPITN